MIEKKQVIKLLEDIADLLEFKAENSFKVNAYRMGAVAIRKLELDINEVVQKKELAKIKGIGKGLQGIIYEFFENGSSSLFDELSAGIPPGVGDLMKIKGLGPRKISILYEQLGISNIEELKEAALQNRLTSLKGFTDLIQSTVIEEITRIKSSSGFILLDQAVSLSEEVRDRISAFKSVDQVILSGTLKRRREVISDISLLVIINNNSLFEQELNNISNYSKDDVCYYITDAYPIVIKVYSVTKNNLTYIDFIISSESGFLNRLPEIPNTIFKSEQQIFSTISLPYIISEMREAEYFSYKDQKNSDIEVGDIKGLLHFHTTYSDGRNTLKEMVSAAKSKNYQYAAVCDHSQSAYYANGLNEERFLLQKKEIDLISEKLGISILSGIESDILKDGSLDFSDDVLVQFQFVVASIHSRFNLNEKEMTLRLIKAIENPYTDVIGHLSGRLLLIRDPYKFKVEKVLDACARNSVAVEINSNPRRLDIDWRYIYYGRDKGCAFAINSDAHSISEIDLVKYGVMMGRKAGLQKNEVINCLDKKNFINFLNKKRKRI